MTSNSSPSSFVDEYKRIMARLKTIQTEEENYNNKNYDISEDVQYTMDNWHIIRKMKRHRALFLLLNRYKYKLNTYEELDIWVNASSDRLYVLNELQNCLSQREFTDEDEKYIRLFINTMKNHDRDFGMYLHCLKNPMVFADFMNSPLYGMFGNLLSNQLNAVPSGILTGHAFPQYQTAHNV